MDNPRNIGAEQIFQAAGLVQEGRLEEAYQLLREILLKDEDNVTAWELLSQATTNKVERSYILNHILDIQPDHAWARKELDELEHSSPGGASHPPEARAPQQEAQTQQQEALPAPPPVLQSSVINIPAPQSALLQSAQPIKKPIKKRRRKTPLVIYFSGALGVLCVALWGIYLMVLLGNYRLNASGQLTQTANALQQANCQVLIDQAMQAAGTSCDNIRGNSVCYGNFTIQSKLVPGSADPFSTRGDIISVEELEQLSASPLNLSNHQWGIAIFKVMANLPRSLPGENVTLMVFGNTTLDNQSPTLETFYFSSQLGQVTCDKVPFDGITIDVPEGSGEQFQINGTQLTLMGNASLKAKQGGSMAVSLYSGSGKIVSQGQEQYFGAGQSVSVGLGGDNGMQAVSAPSTPVPLSPADMQIACTMYGKFCSTTEITPVSAEQAQANIQAEFAPTSTPSQTLTDTPTASPTPTISATASSTPTPITTGTITPTRMISRTPTHAASGTKTPTPGGTVLPTATFSRTPPPTNTPMASNTFTDTPPTTPTYVPTSTAWVTYTSIPTNIPTNTPIPTSIPTNTPIPTSIPTRTNTPIPTKTPTIVPSPTPVIVVNIIVPPSSGLHPHLGQTDFQARAHDPGVGGWNGAGISYLLFWFTDSAGNPVSGLPSASSPHRENSVKYCAFGGGGTCSHMDSGTYTSLPPDTYTMYVQAYATHGGTSTTSTTFIIP